MKQFFYIVFGGLAIVILCLFFVKVGVSVTTPAPVVPVAPSSVTYEEDNQNETFDLLYSMSTTTAIAISAKSYVVMNVDNGSITISRNSDRILPIASLTKLVTAVVAENVLSSGVRIVISKQVLDTYGNSAGFREGEVFMSDDLLYPLLLVSSNDAAEALAMSYGRTEFIKVMNDFARSIGAPSTHFDDPAGLSPKSVSTARDQAIIMSWIYKNHPELIDITALKLKTIRSHTWVNPTHLLSWSYYLGGKNGYLPEANRTGVSLFKFSSTTPTYAVVVLGSQARDSDVVSLVRQIKK